MIVRQVGPLRQKVRAWKRAGQSVGVVPTMGALHAGHLSLVDAARAACDRVIVTIFVNPRQFNSPEDLANYPRTETRDAALLAPFEVDAIFVPDPDQVYPAGFATNVSVSGVSEGLCGAHRPGHFDGVATVVSKLFGMTGAERAYFGEKDFQQLQVVRRLVADLDLDVEIIGCPTVREADGLALSSRNARLDTAARAAAPALYRALQDASEALVAGAPVAPTLAAARAAILAGGYAEVEYLELRAEDGLAPLEQADRPARLLAAAWIGGVRLIDNIRL
ncbi:pantoate--beta-alanine ligase [Phaeovulum vinaykumarii]|uniref:Pantothenate synthetase n=1 Tax=Phaeovulum vinaykumarii TaxID=407234 RepID=A0A1N7K1X8_9RHOB|nr:pantoate--beta-alanine ligase [Phaeovulum vinaykumarii]SIS55602.1 pantothenate synthetase [Phaeovulum vinaykumarii]SOB92453.1 pantothenate synthetase [Phaeovulum vinaykumarii]